ncbi:MAG: hypothetical protein GX115_10570 [Ruminiclostridium sp.]|nr:hypothetical protein [Ruminiclostridium sp.]
MIQFDTAAEKLGSDTIRYLFAGAGVANDVRFGYSLGEEARRKILSFWNTCVFFMTYAVLEKPELAKKPSPDALEITDRWVLARTDQFIREASVFYEEAGLKVEQRIVLSIRPCQCVRSQGQQPGHLHSEYSTHNATGQEDMSGGCESMHVIPVNQPSTNQGCGANLSGMEQGEGGPESNRIQAVLQKYGTAIAEETLSSSFTDVVSEPVITKEVAVGDDTVFIKIGLA